MCSHLGSVREALFINIVIYYSVYIIIHVYFGKYGKFINVGEMAEYSKSYKKDIYSLHLLTFLFCHFVVFNIFMVMCVYNSASPFFSPNTDSLLCYSVRSTHYLNVCTFNQVHRLPFPMVTN